MSDNFPIQTVAGLQSAIARAGYHEAALHPIPVGDWKAELERVHAITPEFHGHTKHELANSLGVSPSVMDRTLRKLLAQKRCKKGVAYRFTSNGRKQAVPVYQLLSNQPEEKNEAP